MDFYLKNSDEYIRRLAILRLQKLPCKESVYFIKEIFDDPIESDENKYLAAWVLKSLSKKWSNEIFINNRYLEKFSGSESFEELFSLKLEHSSCAIEFDFKTNLSHSKLNLESDESVLERDIFFETEFDFRHWFSRFGSRLFKTSVRALSAVPVFILKLPVFLSNNFFTFIKKRLQHHTIIKKKKAILDNKPYKPERVKQNNPSFDYYNLRSELNKKTNILAFIKKGVYQLLYLLFFPIRYVLKHKVAILCVFLLTYALLTFTEYGRAFTNKYMAFDLKEVQNGTVQKAKDYSVYLKNELNRLSGIDEWKHKDKTLLSDSSVPQKITDVSDLAVDRVKHYTITAKKGLNIRKSPDAAAERVGLNSLTYGSTVAYLSEAKKDASGITWYYVEAKDGRIGWVSAMFLKEKAEG